LYHRDRTKNAFVYDGNENDREEDDSSYNKKERASSQGKDQTSASTGQEDFGYGGYKRGHPDVKADWQHPNNKQSHKVEDAMWNDVKVAKQQVQ
jgi:hypothetical protein